MKVGLLIKPNEKGQVVIPKKMRDDLRINSKTTLNLVRMGDGIYIQPVEHVVVRSETESSYLKLLGKTKGTWKDEDWNHLSRQRSKLELAASRARKKSW